MASTQQLVMAVHHVATPTAKVCCDLRCRQRAGAVLTALLICWLTSQQLELEVLVTQPHSESKGSAAFIHHRQIMQQLGLFEQRCCLLCLTAPLMQVPFAMILL